MGIVLEAEVTHALREIHSGDAEAKDRLNRLIYGELRRMAGQLMRRERPDHTLQPTALVNEALLRLFAGDAFSLATNHNHLFGSAAQAMREILVDHARRRNAISRGGNLHRLPLDAVLAYFKELDLDILSLHEALDRLASIHERPAQVVTLRFFGGLTVASIAEELDVSVTTVETDFRIARAWLRRQMAKDHEP